MTIGKITGEILEAYLNCKTKAHLKLQGEQDTSTDYELLRSEMRDKIRLEAFKKIEAAHPEAEVFSNLQATVSTLKRGGVFLEAHIEVSPLHLIIDGLQKAPGPCNLGNFHYLPLLCYEGQTIRQNQRQLMAILGTVIGNLQGRMPAIGLIYHARECKLTRVQLSAGLQEKARRILHEVKELHASEQPPSLILNSHCRMCEFRDRCHAQAMNDDDLSLLRGMGEKEIRKYNRKGIFTTTQLSCTFRLRKKGKRVKRVQRPHYFALQAAAIRDKKVYVLKPPTLSQSSVQIYLDIEGDQERSFVYLLGMLIIENGVESWHSFWADNREQESQLLQHFLDALRQYDNFVLFHYGSYETSFFKRMQRIRHKKTAIAKVLDRSYNILAIVHSHVYFPLYSNGLKDIGKYLGCTWSNENADGLQSIVWRQRWEESHNQTLRHKLETYNHEDCMALRRVVDFLAEVCTENFSDNIDPRENTRGPLIAPAECINPQTSRRDLGQRSFASPELEFVNKCAYFDYQRDKVFLRTNNVLRRIHSQKRKKKRGIKLRINRTIEVKSRQCPYCGSTALVRNYSNMHTKLAYDLKLSGAGINRQVIACTAPLHQCMQCKKHFLPTRYKRRTKHFHSLRSWTMYQHVVHRMSYQQLEEMIEECFDLPVRYQEIHMFKLLLARYYRRTYQQIISRIISGEIVHADETHINLQKGKGYVWVLANMDEVAYVYRPTREGDWVQELLSDFTGVLITDFYSAYDSIKCNQQKCLVHLIRDMNHDLLGSPYDEEFKWLVSQFGSMLSAVIASVDRYGLKRRHLNKHLVDVDRFYRAVRKRSFRSELATGYHKRLIRYRDKLFTFLKHDGVPWNNNNAEHAVKHFAHYREVVEGKVTEGPLRDYLVLLTIYQTCEYRGISFLRFLLSGEKDVDAFHDSARPTPGTLSLQVYPKGCASYYRNRTKRKEKPSD